ncbi:amino acid ABC transporter substrate-binding protein [Psychromonas marina]|uniref:Amino acid ABC transporter substrate-binding protein n=1 Tax=Psychromonas marina TaxID=88364 RepID=A0ABQ6E3V3_9GAMM|nr:transporter substrate-binding domain-containing protein [Psychromonas marina]GLS92134.1 amino acid ABC transporter substrate-binding protein [Psychromonas marina]
MKYSKNWLITAIVFIALPFTQTSPAETLRVMLHTGSFPPYFFEEGDQRTGTIKDIFTAISQETGDSIEYVRVPFKRALRLFENGEIDIEPMTNPIWRQNSSIQSVYSIPFTASEDVIIFQADKYIAVHSGDDLLGKRLGVVQGYSYPAYQAYFAAGRIKAAPFHDENKLIQLLIAKRLDQALINKDFAQYQIKNENLTGQLKIGEPYSVLDMMIRFHPSKAHVLPRFNKALKKLLKSGSINNIYNRYR